MTSFVLVRPWNFYAFDDKWTSLFRKGEMIRLAGGTEVEEIERVDGWVVVKINDDCYPPIVCRVQASVIDAVLTKVNPGTGRRTKGVVVDCGHVESDRDCLVCWLKYWTEKACFLGLGQAYDPPTLIKGTK